jgi:hypothetical protein
MTEIYDQIAKTNSEYLIKLLLDPKELNANKYCSAESLALAKPSNTVLETLLFLLSNKDSVLRESAIYGLRPYYGILKVKETLANIFNTDTSVGVRQVAEEALFEWDCPQK